MAIHLLTIPWNFATDTVDCDITLYAGWKRNTINVTFNTSGGQFADGSTVKVVEITAGNGATSPETPMREKYSFVDWSEDGSTPFNFSIPPENDITLYAMWERSVFTVTLDANGGAFTDGQSIHTVEVNKLQAIGSAETPSKEGYSFKAWYVNGEQWDPSAAISKDITATAIWEQLVDMDSDKLHVKYKEHEWEDKKEP